MPLPTFTVKRMTCRILSDGNYTYISIDIHYTCINQLNHITYSLFITKFTSHLFESLKWNICPWINVVIMDKNAK